MADDVKALPRINGGVLCDEVRVEHNQKLFLIGVYSGDLVVEQIPTGLVLTVYLDLELPRGETKLNVRLSGPRESQSGMEGMIEAIRDGSVGVPSAKLPVSCTAEGPLRVEVQFNDTGVWQGVLEKRVILRSTFNQE